MANRPSLDLAEFRRRYPEFIRPATGPEAAAADALVTAKLAEAARSIDADVWGNTPEGGATPAQDGGYTLAAHLLAVSPYGQAARLGSSSGESTYLKSYERLLRQVALGFRTI